MKHDDYFVTYSGSRWTVSQGSKHQSNHATQQAAIEWAKYKAGVDLEHLDKKLVGVWWTDRQGNLQGHIDYRSLTHHSRGYLKSLFKKVFRRGTSS